MLTRERYISSATHTPGSDAVIAQYHLYVIQLLKVLMLWCWSGGKAQGTFPSPGLENWECSRTVVNPPSIRSWVPPQLDLSSLSA